MTIAAIDSITIPAAVVRRLAQQRRAAAIRRRSLVGLAGNCPLLSTVQVDKLAADQGPTVAEFAIEVKYAEP